jgi:hypothetical protein
MEILISRISLLRKRAEARNDAFTIMVHTCPALVRKYILGRNDAELIAVIHEGTASA